MCTYFISVCMFVDTWCWTCTAGVWLKPKPEPLSVVTDADRHTEDMMKSQSNMNILLLQTFLVPSAGFCVSTPHKCISVTCFHKLCESFPCCSSHQKPGCSTFCTFSRRVTSKEFKLPVFDIKSVFMLTTS